MSDAFAAVYDFELLPYALGDVLTWNIQTALRCVEAGRTSLDAYICVDPRYPASIYQRGLVVADNCALFFNELLGAFATHPIPGNIHVYTDRDAMLARLREIAKTDNEAASALADYEAVLARRNDEHALNAYFIKYIYSHEKINGYHEAHGDIPLLTASRGCEPDIDGLLENVLANKRVVVIHPRLRRLDNGMAGDHTYFRDSDFLEWYEFVRETASRRSDVQFVVVGRLQEKPLELLRLPNVMSLRTLGLGLGHELTLMLKADLFIGTSSGFAAMANFSKTPYFVTKMNPESCTAYAIPNGATRLPFATHDQTLVYEPETVALLTRLLDRGLAGAPRRLIQAARERKVGIDVGGFAAERANWLKEASSTSRYFIDNAHADQETAFLLVPQVEAADRLAKAGKLEEAKAAIERIIKSFPRLARGFPELIRVGSGQRLERKRVRAASAWLTVRLQRTGANILPSVLRGTRVHTLARRVKNSIIVSMRP